MKKVSILAILLFGFLKLSYAATYYVSTSGNDASGNGSSSAPWRTIKTALSKVPANQGHTIKISAGTFVESGPLNVPLQVNIEGAGATTIIKAAPSFYYTMTGTWEIHKLLFRFASSVGTDGNQSIKNLVIDGSSRKLYGGIFIKGRNRVRVEGVTVQYCGFIGLWLLDAKDCRVTNVKLRDNAWHNSSYATASLGISNVERVEIDHVDIDENYGAAIKAMGTQAGYIRNIKVHDNKLSTSPTGRWMGDHGSTTPSIVFELYEYYLTGNEVYNNVFEGNVSLVAWSNQFTPKGTQTIRVYNNVFDCMSHADGASYGLELSIHDVEIDHNYFNGGHWGITNWVSHNKTVPYQNWKIHHNVFYNIMGKFPGIIRTEYKGLRNVEIYNNTVELNGQKELSFIQLIAGNSSNFKVKNNLVINSTTGPYDYYGPQFIRVAPGATLSGLVVTHNFLQNLPISTTPGTYSNNLSGDPQINKTGNRPAAYYKLKAGSPLIDKGVNVGFSYSGSAPDIGAYESGSTSTTPTPAPSSGSNTIVVRMRGVSGSESVQLEVNNVAIAKWKLTTSMTNYTATTSSTGTINVRYTNDTPDRDVQIDYIQVNGSTRQAEAQTLNTGVYQNGRCGGVKSEWLHCSGYIAFGDVGGSTTVTTPTPTPSSGSNTIVVRMRGVSGSESVQLEVNNVAIAKWKLTTSMANYTATTSSTGAINVRYTNDTPDRDVQIDYIQVNGSTRQAEAQTLNTGVYQNGRCGGVKSEWLHCSGYIAFGDVGGSTTVTTPTPAPSSGSNTIVVRMRGVSGSESVQLEVNNVAIAKWKLTTSMANYTATTSSTGAINVRYTNDTPDRDVQIDYIQVNGSTRQAEAQTLNTGVYQNGRCGGVKSEWLHCSGYIAFGDVGGSTTVTTPTPTPSSGSNTIVVRMRGVSGSESVQLEVNNVAIAKWKLTTSMANYTATTSSTGAINVRYTNDTPDRDVQIDYIQVNGSTRQAEAQTLNTGVYQSGRCGGVKSEWLNCSGYIAFGDVTSSSSVARLRTESEEPLEIPEFSLEKAVLRFANPVNDGILRMEFEEELSEIRILDFSGRTMKVFFTREEKKLNEELGLIPGMYIIQPVKSGEKVRPQRLIVE